MLMLVGKIMKLQKTRVMGVDAITPYMVNALIDLRVSTVWIRPATGEVTGEPDVIITNVNNQERFDDLQTKFPRAAIAILKDNGPQHIVSPGPYHGWDLHSAISAIWWCRRNQVGSSL